MKVKILVIALFVTALSCWSQTNEPEKQEKEVGTLDAAWQPVVVDHVFGIRFGYGTGSMRREPARDNQSYPKGLYNFGISYRFDVPEQKYVGTIEIDLQYMEKGFAYATKFDGDEVYSRQYSVIELPILWQPYLPLGKKGSRFFLNAGPYLSYTLGGTERSYSKETGETISQSKYVYSNLRDNRVEYGIVAGAGLVFEVKRFGISVDFRYNIALSDALKGMDKYEGNPFRSPVDQMNLSIGLQYRFIIGKNKKHE